jgi:hypothetical protein
MTYRTNVSTQIKIKTSLYCVSLQKFPRSQNAPVIVEKRAQEVEFFKISERYKICISFTRGQ